MQELLSGVGAGSSSPCAEGHVAAVYHQVGAGHEGGLFACQEHDKVGDVLAGLPKAVPPGRPPLMPNHVDVTPDRDRYRISFVPEGQWLSKAEGAPPDVVQRLTRKDSTKFRRLDRRLPSLTLRCGEAIYHPIEDRYVTPREAARIQGFPDRHVLVGPIRRRTGNVRDLDQHRQVANAVPPPLAQEVALSVRASLCL